MLECVRCETHLEDGAVLSGSKVYAKLAGGEDRDEILAAYSGIKYGTSTTYCSECLDTPRECEACGGSGVGGDDSEDTGASEPCPECDGTGTTKPKILRDACRF